MNRGEIRTLVRSLSRTETFDVPDASLDVYIDEGYSEVVSNRVWSWAYGLIPETVPLLVGVAEYTLDPKIKRVLEVIQVEQRYPLRKISQSDWARMQETIQSTSRPVAYTFARQTLFIWPAPATTDSLDLYYYEHPVWGAADIDIPPFEESFHSSIADWALSRLWEEEEDFEKADDYRQRFEVKLNRMEKFYNTEMVGRPMVFGDGFDSRYGPSSLPWLSDANLGGAS